MNDNATRLTRRSRLGRHAGRQITNGDTRSPMRRLLEDCETTSGGSVEVEYDQQWRTFFKAVRLGYVDETTHAITPTGRAFLAAQKESK